ncbi:hypothetical protein Tco_1118521 [Tanacetum coccineum]
MDSILSLGQKNTLVEYMMLSGAGNRPPMLDKDLYDSWKSQMELYMQNREHGRMILEAVEHGPLIWPTVEDNGMKMEQFQVNTKFLNSLPPEWSKFVTNVKLVKDLHASNFDQLHAYLKQHELHANEVLAYQSPPAPTQPVTKSPFMDSGFVVPVFSPRDDPIACLNKAMAFANRYSFFKGPFYQ